MTAQRASGARPRIAVVTVSYDSAAVLGPFLDSVPAAAARTELDVVVADNKPGSPARAEVERLVADAGGRYLPMTGNVGYGHAINEAVASLGGDHEFVLVSNPDVVLAPGSVDVLVDTMLELDDAGAIGPKILESDGSAYPSARSVPSIRNGIGHALFANVWPANPWTRSYRLEIGENPVRRDAGWLSGSCFLVRREVFDALGGFDTGYFMYFEDVDLGYRIGQAGWRNVYEPAAEVLHTGAHSTTTESARMLQAHHDSAKRFLAKKYSGPLWWPLRAVLSLGLGVRSAFVRRRSAH
ncbi:glycosyltransferase family 2 protein [Herbiconiux flava]|uniref:N-acetylglucosaminyl-diphospho-decaprenol L-rhamnosyltransferase n=1 Tax=Herbiconiux flava TaxID=881268 RepID=A0A852SUQ4_9MICO|nr:glycosyltransferase family 2 protein [Herbiconiux flava]NYD72364.1 N-acetylglucosaminyl-diphospho-decaprenol L-rhamnosyltransferase [Herbiconiux flava]GLK17672.1 glycosyl transferase [Herbiconiux flava]